MIIELPYPDKTLWPNGGSKHNHYKLNRIKQKHRDWANLATLEAMGLHNWEPHQGRLSIHIRVFPKSRGRAPDKDNIVASIKAFQDGISDAIGIDDSLFGAPTVEIADKREGRFEIEVTQ